jgi:putative phosphoribosyl transferase
MIFKDRQQAGKLLCEKLTAYRGKGCVVIGLARGGIVVAWEIAAYLGSPLDILVIKKLSSPENKEFGIGAVAQDGVSFIDWKSAGRLGADEMSVKRETERLSFEIKQLLQDYRKVHAFVKLQGKTVILVDDGIATGVTMKTAVKWLKIKKAKKIIIAVPVIPPDLVKTVKQNEIEIIYLEAPEVFGSVSEFYDDFKPVSEGNVKEILQGGKLGT